jgi:uncharacterized repeat protein (TIGR01451 family)
MKFRFLMAALAVVAAGGLFLGSRSDSAEAGPGPDIEISCPAVVVQGATFSCINGWGAFGATAPNQGYQFVIVYDSPACTGTCPSGTPPGVGTAMTVNSRTLLYAKESMWESAPAANDGDEFCPPSSFNTGSALLPTGYVGSGTGCVSLVGPASTSPASIVSWNFTANGLGSFPVHQVTFGGGGPTFGTYTIDASAPQTPQTYVCTGAVCSPTPFSTPDNLEDPIVTIIQPPPDIETDKTGSAPAVVAGQPYSHTITVTNNSLTTTATGVGISDTFPAAFTGLVENPDDPNCSIAGQVLTCSGISLAPGASFSVTVDSVVDTAAGGTTQQNCATATQTTAGSSPDANDTDCFDTNVIPPAVAWSKDPSLLQVFLCENGSPPTNGCTVAGQTGLVEFDEVLTNQGDPNGLGSFEFTIKYDNTIFSAPSVDTSPAAALFTAAGRTLICTMSIPQETQTHVACASTGTLYVGPSWVGSQVMANVDIVIKASVRGALYPHKHNGIVTRIDDVGTEVANTCGQPLNDGTETPLPGQESECQGNLLLGVLPGGLLPDSVLFITIRRLEADLDKDCDVDVSDMQNIAGRYGFGFGSLLYQIWYDLEPHQTGADGDIDIKDVQFVFGRAGSTCAVPIPAQVPQLPVDP